MQITQKYPAEADEEENNSCGPIAHRLEVEGGRGGPVRQAASQPATQPAEQRHERERRSSIIHPLTKVTGIRNHCHPSDQTGNKMIKLYSRMVQSSFFRTHSKEQCLRQIDPPTHCPSPLNTNTLRPTRIITHAPSSRARPVGSLEGGVEIWVDYFLRIAEL